jgi:hypothetical protein
VQEVEAELLGGDEAGAADVGGQEDGDVFR